MAVRSGQIHQILALGAYLLTLAVSFVNSDAVGTNTNETLDRKAPSLKFEVLTLCLTADGVPGDRIVARDTSNSEERVEYKELNWQWNKLHGQIMPIGYLLARRAADVQAAVRCCTKTGVRIVARSGGHSFVKYSFGDKESFIVDLQRMNQVVVDESKTMATIGAGARSGQIQYQLWSQGRLFTSSADCTMVGITGYTLGGGFGYFAHLIGISADTLVEARVVDWKGRLLLANSETNPDLYWALRGGGGGNFGIVTSMKLKTYVAPTRIAYATRKYRLEDFATFYKAWQAFITSGTLSSRTQTWLNMDSMGITMEFTDMNMKQGGGNEAAGAGSAGEVESLLSKWFPQPTPINSTLREYSFPDFLVYRAQQFAEFPITTPEQLPNVTRIRKEFVLWRRVKSFIVDRILTRDEDIAELATMFRDYLRYSNLFVEHYGGQMNALSPTDTAFVHRGRALYDVQIQATSTDGKVNQTKVDAMNRFFDGTKRLLGHNQSYQNYLDEDLPDYLQRYYGVNLQRLVDIKRKYDPNNVFHHPQSIPVTL